MILSILDRHIGRGIFISTVLVFGVLLALSIFIVFVRAMADFGKFNFGLPELVHYVIMSQPRQLYELFPIIVLIGAIMGLSAMALNSELIAMRAAGVSVARIVGSAMKAGLMFVIVQLTAGEYVVPFAESVAQRERAQALHESLQQRSSGLWLRDGEAFVNIGEVLPDLSLLRVNIYHFSDSTRLPQPDLCQSRETPRRAMAAGGCAPELHSGPKRAFPACARTDLGHGTHAGTSCRFCRSAGGLSIQQLYRYIEHLRQNNQEIERYQLAFWQKIFMPLATAVMVLLATPFVFRPVRSGGLGQRVFPRRHVGIGVRGVEPDYRLLRFALRFVAGGQRLDADPDCSSGSPWCCCAVRRTSKSRSAAVGLLLYNQNIRQPHQTRAGETIVPGKFFTVHHHHRSRGRGRARKRSRRQSA